MLMVLQSALLVFLGLIYQGNCTETYFTHEYKSIEYLGTQHNYIMYNLQFDSDLYFVENWPCPCVNDSLTPKYFDKVSDANVTILTRNEAVEMTIDAETVFFAFEVTPDDYGKIIKFYLSNHWGEVNGYISRGQIPYPNSYELNKYAKARDSLWICPTETWYGVGWWYVSVSRNEPYNANHFSIRWDTVSVPLCTKQKVEARIDDRILLQNDIGYYGKARYFQYSYFEYQVDEECTDFSFCVKQTTSDFGDIDVYMSTIDKHPDINNHQYASQNNGNDGISVIGLCNISSIYIGIYSWQGDYVPYVITATNSSTFEYRKVHELAPQQFLYTMSYGQATLECPTEDVRCEFYSYQGCLDPYDIWYCCARFGFLPPHEDTELWVVDQPEVTNGNYNSLPFESYPSVEDNVRGKLVLFQYLNSVSLDDGRVLTDSICAIRFNNMIVDSSYKPLSNKIVTTQAVYQCDLNSDKIDSVIQRISQETDIPTLKLLDINLSNLMNSNSIQGCKSLLYNTSITKTQILSWNSYYCDSNYTDPCCSWNLTLWNACHKHNVTVINQKIFAGNSSSVCVNKTINNFADTWNPLVCLSNWKKSINEVSTSFIYSCAVKLFGTFEFLGKYCADNTECPCNLLTGTCDYTTTDYIDCLWEEMNQMVPVALMNYWMLNRTVVKDDLIQRYIKPMCTGPGSLGFRSHYSYLLTLPTCIDDCVRNNVTLECYTPNTEACPVDDICPPGSSTDCYRRFHFYEGNSQICEKDVYCNSESTKCDNHEYVCLDCTSSLLNNGTCIYLPNYNQTTCTYLEVSKGYCTDGISDFNSCGSTTYCDGEQNLVSGCYGQFQADFYGNPLCSGKRADNPWGCFNTSCYRYLEKGTCNQTYACYDNKIFNYMSQDDCLYSGFEWRTLFQWKRGMWVSGITKPLTWTLARYQSIRKIQPTVDYISLYNDINQAVSDIISLKYRQNAECRTSALLETLRVVAGNDTYSSGNILGSEWACRGKETVISDILTVNNVSSFCSVVSVGIVQANLYQKDPSRRLSSQLFTNAAPNSWSVIYDSFLIQGQIVTDGAQITWSDLIAGSIILCLNISVTDHSQLFDTYGLGIVNNYTITVLDISVTHNMCANITSPGVYIGVKYRDTGAIYESLLIQSIIASILYFILLGGVMFQIVNIVLIKPSRYRLKLVFGFVTALFLLMRGVYFILYITGIINENTVSSYVFFEFATYLFLIMNSAIIFIWFEIAYHTKNVHKSSTFSNGMFSIWLLWNLIILLSFIGFIIAYYVVPQAETYACSLLYFQLSESDAVARVSRGYTVFVATVCFIMSVGFVVSGIIFIYQISSISKGSDALNNVTLKTWLTLSVFCICFTVKSILMLAGEFIGLIVPIIVFALLEQISTSVLMYYLRPPVANEVKLLITSPTSSKSSKRKTSLSTTPPGSIN